MNSGGGRGIGLALSKVCLEAGAVVGVTDILAQPDPEFIACRQDAPDRLFYYQYVLSTYRDGPKTAC